MVSKKLLSAAIAAAFISAPTFAIDLEDGTGALAYAKEAFTEANEGDEAGFYEVTGTFDASVELGFGVSNANQVWVRYDLTNAVLDTAVDVADLDVSDFAAAPEVEIAAGGEAGDNYVIFAITTDANEGQSTELVLELASLEIKLNATASLAYSLYDDASDAAAGGTAGRVGPVESATLVELEDALTVTFTADDAVADVDTDFTEFVTDNLSTILGTVEFNLDTALLLPDGTNVADMNELIQNAADESTVVLTGDLSFGDWTVGGVAVDADTGVADISTLTDGVEYDVVVTVDGDTTIEAGAYSLATDFADLEDAVFGATNDSEAIGEITRNGTSVKLPFVNINPSFNQRIIIVNRSANDVPLTISDVIADATANGFALTPAGAATITLPAGKQTILSSSDLFQVTNSMVSKRGAATLNIAAPVNKIDVLFQTTNDDGAQNTVILQNDGQKFGGNDVL
jgi:hypothetical protein